MAKQASATTNADQQSIEQLQKRYESLNTRKIQAETHRDNAKKRLEELRSEARDKYGTDDVAELEKKLAEMKADNERKRSEYQQSLDKIEGELAEVEKKFAAAEDSSSGNGEPA